MPARSVFPVLTLAVLAACLALPGADDATVGAERARDFVVHASTYEFARAALQSRRRRDALTRSR